MSVFLAIDTASAEAIALAIHDEATGETESFEREAPQAQSTSLLPAVHELGGQRLRGLAAVVVVSGPGSYAGLRVGIATAEGLGLSRGVPVFGVPTLRAVAAASKLVTGHAVHAMGRSEWAAQQFEAGQVRGGPFLLPGRDLAELGPLAGEGAAALGGDEVSPAARCRAGLLAALPAIVDASAVPGVEALYLREPNITRPRPRAVVAD